MSKLDKFWNWLGIADEEVVTEQILDLPTGNELNSKTPNVVSIHTNKNMKVMVCEPQNFDEVQMLADHLKNRKQVIVNFENTPDDVSRRIFDFISGTTYALDGNSQQLGKDVFLFAPSNVEISKDARSLMMLHKNRTPFGGDR